MAVTGYIFIECDKGKAIAASRAIKKIEGIKMAHAVTGPYDVVALGEADTIPALGNLVIKRIQGTPGVVRTITSVVVD